MKADIKSHESKIVSLEARVDNLKKELKYYKSLSASHHSFSELEVTSNSDVDSTNFKKEHNSGRRENIYEKQLKAYGFSSRISIVSSIFFSVTIVLKLSTFRLILFVIRFRKMIFPATSLN